MKSIFFIAVMFLLSFTQIFAQQTMKDKGDKVYKTVKIGNQIWMAENLAYKASSGCWAYEDNKNNVSKYGYLYNYETAINICPSGWHLPSDDEWKELEMNLGMSQDNANETEWRGTISTKLKAETGWNSSDGTDESGFSAVAGGYRYSNGAYDEAGLFGCWWTATSDANYAWCRKFYGFDATIGRVKEDKGYSLSVRCIKD